MAFLKRANQLPDGIGKARIYIRSHIYNLQGRGLTKVYLSSEEWHLTTCLGESNLQGREMKHSSPFQLCYSISLFWTLENLNEFKSCKSPKIFSVFSIALKQGDYLPRLSSIQSYLGDSGRCCLNLLVGQEACSPSSGQ